MAVFVVTLDNQPFSSWLNLEINLLNLFLDQDITLTSKFMHPLNFWLFKNYIDFCGNVCEDKSKKICEVTEEEICLQNFKPPPKRASQSNICSSFYGFQRFLPSITLEKYGDEP